MFSSGAVYTRVRDLYFLFFQGDDDKDFSLLNKGWGGGIEPSGMSTLINSSSTRIFLDHTG